MTERRNRMYRIYPDGTRAEWIKVYCDMETEGGGWAVFQRRGEMWPWFPPSVELGFGKVATMSEFWLGNDNINLLTVNRSISLRVELESWRNPHTKVYATYQHFSVGDEKSNYKLEVSGYGGTAGNALSYHNSMPFQAIEDKQNDPFDFNCVTIEVDGCTALASFLIWT